MTKSSTGLIVAISLMLFAPLLSARSSEVQRLRELSPKAERYSVETPYSSTKAGAARVYVDAPVHVTKQTVTDYANYGKMIESFDEAKVVGRHGDKTDVYLKVPILGGLTSIWGILRFNLPEQVGEDEYVVKAKLVKGNVKRFDAFYRIRRIDEQSALLNLEMLIVPKLPGVPRSLVTKEVSKACDKAVRRLRDGAQRMKG